MVKLNCSFKCNTQTKYQLIRKLTYNRNKEQTTTATDRKKKNPALINAGPKKAWLQNTAGFVRTEISKSVALCLAIHFVRIRHPLPCIRNEVRSYLRKSRKAHRQKAKADPHCRGSEYKSVRFHSRTV